LDTIKKPAEYKRVDIYEELERVKNGGLNYPNGLKIVNVRGTNASGKSTIPMQMLANDEDAYILTEKDEKGKAKDIATVFPKYNFVALGTYFTKTGGLDRIRTTADMKRIFSLVHFLPYSIILEGILASTVFSTYANMFLEYEAKKPKRKAIIFSILPPFEVIKERVLKRNGGNDNIKWEQLESKWRTVKKNVAKFDEAGLVSLEVDNSNIKLEDTLEWFFNTINEEETK